MDVFDSVHLAAKRGEVEGKTWLAIMAAHEIDTVVIKSLIWIKKSKKSNLKRNMGARLLSRLLRINYGRMNH